jgi:hypothetical protein
MARLVGGWGNAKFFDAATNFVTPKKVEKHWTITDNINPMITVSKCYNYLR